MQTSLFPGSFNLRGSDGSGGTRDVFGQYQGIQFDHYHNDNTQDVLRIDNNYGGSIRSYSKNNGTTPSSQTYWEFGHAGDLDCPNHYRLGYYGSITAGYGGFLRLYSNNTESTPTIEVDGHTAKVNTYNSSGTVVHQFPPVSLTKPAVTLTTTANTWKYSGLYVTIPAGAFYTFDVRARYSTVAPDFIGISTSNSTFNNGSGSPEKVSRLPFANGSYVGSNYIDGTSHRMTVSGENDTNSSITYYIWAQTISAGRIGVGVSGYYM